LQGWLDRGEKKRRGGERGGTIYKFGSPKQEKSSVSYWDHKRIGIGEKEKVEGKTYTGPKKGKNTMKCSQTHR